LFASIGVSLSWILVFFTGRILTDLPAAFFVLLALLFFWKGYVLKEGNKFLYLFGLFLALAILTRMQSFMFIPPFLIYIFITEKFKMFKNKHLWITLGIFLLLLIPQFVLYAIHYGNPLTDLAAHYLGIGVSSSSTSYSGDQRGITMAIFNYFYSVSGGQQVGLPYMMSTLIFILLLAGTLYFFSDLFIGIDKLFKNKTLQDKFFVLTWILSLFLIMGFIGQISYVEQRYVSAGLPFLFMIAISPLWFIGETLVKHSHINKKIVYFILVVGFILLLIPNFNTANSMTDQKLTSYKEIQEAGLWIKANSNSSDLIMTQSRPQIVYYAERNVQPGELNMFENESFFESTVKELKPKYLVLSSFEQSPDWVYTYPLNHSNVLFPVQAYPQDKPVVIVYEFKYS
jgi:4-amino-4-deoxy-L-arabinose transferase-like glycosyltransferase